MTAYRVLHITRRRFNFFLLAIIVVTNGFLLFGFLTPIVQPEVTKLTNPVKLAIKSEAKNIENTLIIPKIQLKTPIKKENTPASLNNAAWLRPASVEPGQGGNSILAGHRFSYLVNPVFYNLDRLAAGDEIQVVWNHKIFSYKVSEVKIVEPTAVEIETQNFGERLTLYTCTPLWSTTKRLVVIAEPLEVQNHG